MHVQNEIMTSIIYWYIIVVQYAHLFQDAMGAKFVFVGDNARLPCGNIVNKILLSKDVNRMK